MPQQLGFGGLPLPSLQQFASLTPAELQAANTSLGAIHNTTLEDVGFETQRRFGALGPANRAHRVG